MEEEERRKKCFHLINTGTRGTKGKKDTSTMVHRVILTAHTEAEAHQEVVVVQTVHQVAHQVQMVHPEEEEEEEEEEARQTAHQEEEEVQTVHQEEEAHQEEEVVQTVHQEEEEEAHQTAHQGQTEEAHLVLLTVHQEEEEVPNKEDNVLILRQWVPESPRRISMQTQNAVWRRLPYTVAIMQQ